MESTASSLTTPRPILLTGASSSTHETTWPPAGLTAERLLREHRIGVAPGEGFGARGAGWVRLSYALADEDLEEGARRLAVAVAAGISGQATG